MGCKEVTVTMLVFIAYAMVLHLAKNKSPSPPQSGNNFVNNAQQQPQPVFDTFALDCLKGKSSTNNNVNNNNNNNLFMTIALMNAPRPDNSFHLLNTIKSIVAQIRGVSSYTNNDVAPTSGNTGGPFTLHSKIKILIVNYFGESHSAIIKSIEQLFKSEIEQLNLIEIVHEQDPTLQYESVLKYMDKEQQSVRQNNNSCVLYCNYYSNTCNFFTRYASN